MIPSTTNKYLVGQYNLEGIEYNVHYFFKKYSKAEIVLQNNSNEIVSAYKLEEDKEYAYKSLTARELYIEFLFVSHHKERTNRVNRLLQFRIRCN